MFCNECRVEKIEFFIFNSVILYKFNLYKYKGGVYILTQIIRGISHKQNMVRKAYILVGIKIGTACASGTFRSGAREICRTDFQPERMLINCALSQPRQILLLSKHIHMRIYNTHAWHTSINVYLHSKQLTYFTAIYHCT